MRRHRKASSAGPNASGTSRRATIAFLAALVFAITISLGAAAAVADAPPAVTIDAPTEVSYTTAQISGTVDPEGGPSATTWFFQTSTNPADPSLWETQSSAAGEISGAEAEASDPVPVGGTLYLPATDTQYWVRLVAENEESANRVETGPPYLTFTTLATTPPTVTIDPPTEVTTNSARFSGTINPEGNDGVDGVSWRFQCVPECPGLGEGFVNSGTTPVPVSVDAKELQPNTAYEVRLIATKTGAEAEAGPEIFTTPAAAPFASTLGATPAAGGTSATVGGRVNPNNSATTYWIEYGTSESYGQSAPVSKDADAGSGGEPILVSQVLSGLTPGARYHFRVVAENAVGTTFGQDLSFEIPAATAPPAASCPNQALRVGPSALLPSCRAYEQVSPQDKNESNAAASGFTADGEHMRVSATGAFAGAPRGGINQYLGTRTPQGWETSWLTPALPPENPNSPIPPAVTLNENGSLGLVQTGDRLVPEDTNNHNDFYLRDPDGSVDWISRPTASFPPGSAPYLYFFPGDDTADFSHVVFHDSLKRVPGAAGLDDYSYGLYDATGGSLSLVNVDSAGNLLNPYGAGLGSGVAGRYEHALSRDGERIFFTAPSSVEPVPSPFDTRRIYLRESDRTTTEISVSQCTEAACEGPEQDATYEGAAADGSVAFFTSGAQLTNDATPGGGLYRYEVGSGELTLLTPGGDGVKGTVGNSDDGSLVYFVATDHLADGAVDGANNLYVYDAASEATAFIATLNPEDSASWRDGERRSVEVTPSGEHLTFRTAAPLLAGYDNAGHYEIYRYDALAAELSCPSCLPSGKPAQDHVSYGPLDNNISDDGGYVFFQTPAPLLSRDRNGKLDVYQWHDGAVSLISSGTSSGPSEFGGASPSGRDVGFSTWERLEPRDIDDQLDAYDARIDGGFQQPPAPPSARCAGDDCRGSGTGSSVLPSPASASFDSGEARPGRRGGFRPLAISPRQLKKWARSGMLSLRVKVPAAGRVKASASARLGKRASTVARGSATARRSGTVTIALRLSNAARSYLERRGRLAVTIAVTYSKSKASKQLRVTLTEQRSKQADSRGQR